MTHATQSAKQNNDKSARKATQTAPEKQSGDRALDPFALGQTIAHPGAARPDEIAFRGRAFHPVWYDANKGEPGFGWVVYFEKAFARLGLIVINDFQRYVLLRMDAPPEHFPNNSEVLVAG